MKKDSSDFPMVTIGSRQYSQGGFNVLVKSGEMGLLTGTGGTAPTYAFAEVQMLTTTEDTADSSFGRLISSDGKTLAIYSGDENSEGTTGLYYIYDLVDGVWVEKQQLPAYTGTSTASGCVSVQGDTIFAGSPWDDSKTTDAGAVMVYQLIDDEWQFTQLLTASDGASGDNFGMGLSVYGDMAVVGAYKYTGSESESGKAYAFRRVDGEWIEDTILYPTTDLRSGSFGRVVEVSEDTIVVAGTAGSYSLTPHTVYVYSYDEVGIDYVQEMNTLDKFTGSTNFGYCMRVRGDMFIVSAYSKSTIVVYKRGDDGFWAESQVIEAIDGRSGAYFGWDFDWYGDTLAVGRWNATTELGQYSGELHIYKYDGDMWNPASVVISENGEGAGSLGYRVQVIDGLIMAAAPYAAVSTGSKLKRCHVFETK